MSYDETAGAICELDSVIGANMDSTDGGDVRRRLFTGGDKLSFDSISSDKKDKIRRAAKLIICHAVDELAWSGFSITFGKACHVAYYSIEGKGEYPFGSLGKLGVHNDLLNFFLCAFEGSSGQDAHDALLAHQFMAQNTLQIKALKDAKSEMISSRCSAVQEELERLPKITQEYLEDWRTKFLKAT